MKLNDLSIATRKAWLSKKTLLVMKLTTFILLIAILQCSASAFSQKISLNETNTPLKKVLSSINKQTGFVFFYESKDIRNKNITINIKDASLDEALKKCLDDQQLNYQVIDKTVFIKEKDQKLSVVEAPAAITPLEIAAINITGQVIDENSLPMPGVTVKLKGGKEGAVTDANGKFTIAVPDASAILVFSFIGYTTQEAPAVSGMRIQLKVDASKLSEVVVIGYGTVKKTDLTGAVASIQAKDLVTAGSSSIDKALQGKLAGSK
jgi:hypothetical protein